MHKRERDSTAGALREKYLPFNRPQLLIRGDSSSFSPTTEQRVQDSKCRRYMYIHARRESARDRHGDVTAASAGHFFTLWPTSLSCNELSAQVNSNALPGGLTAHSLQL